VLAVNLAAMSKTPAPTCCYRFEIPDPAQPLAEAQRTGSGPSGVLVPFEPETPLDPARVIGHPVLDLMANAGTYGMGGPGFFALKLGDDWLVIALWGAAGWMSCEGRMLEDWHSERDGRPAPWFEDDDASALKARLIGQTIEAAEITPQAMRLDFSNGADLSIASDPAARPPYGGSGLPRAFQPEDDLMRAVFLSPTVELWI
jgi:hypothetical protein